MRTKSEPLTTTEVLDDKEPCFVISVAARMVGVRTQTLRYYERLGLLDPHRTRGRQRMYSKSDVNRVRRIRELVEDFGINLAGVEVVMKLLSNIEETHMLNERLMVENQRLIGLLSPDGTGNTPSYEHQTRSDILCENIETTEGE